MDKISNHSFDLLTGVLERFLALDHKFKTALRAVLYETAYQKGSRILGFQQTQRTIWFLLDGLVMESRINEQTFQEKATWFWFPGSIMFDAGFFSEDPSENTMQVTGDSKVALLHFHDWKALKQIFKEVEVLTEKIRRQNEKLRLQHADDVQSLSTSARYLANEASLQLLFAHAKLKNVAEFMGMAPDTLGKLRKKYSGRRGR